MMFTKHKWVVIKTEVLPSEIEQLARVGQVYVFPREKAFYKPCIVTYHCELTGEEKVVRI